MIAKARWFTKVDVIAAFYKIRVAAGDEEKTAFRTRYGSFEWLVAPFGLTGAPAAFQRFINSVLQDYLDDFVSAYIDDVLIFSSGSLQDHRDKVGKVLQRLMDAGLQLDINKSEFEVKAVKYLGFIIEAECGIRVDPEKVKAVKEWATPTNVKSVRSFIGFANFYRMFMPEFSRIAEPLTRLTKKDAPFRWDELCEEAFTKLKDLLITAPILAHFHPERETILEADASGFASGGVLLQRDDKDGLLVENRRAEDITQGETVAEDFIQRLQDATEFAQAAIAMAQEMQQAQANKNRTAAPRYGPGDWVYLNLRNIRTSRPCKKLDWLHAKYQVLEEVNPHAYRLDVPGRIHPVFHVDLLRPVANDPLPSQILDQESAPPVLVDGQEMYLVERILDERMEGTYKKVLVKWHDYSQPTWEPLSTIRHTDVWKQWKKRKKSVTSSSHLDTDRHIPTEEETLKGREVM
ncbi:hypothetical protein ARSEF4850_008972 [Beauveria asiatica]